ncbi:glycine cleavage system protein T [Candidatus Woesearchaeota archaeon]|jgi:aminomethyltransferase|nr:glycine cleavage system protein T [Candidatus Woesearchaeota archaeon]|tara:strand:- start:9770 stop:10891 length:1122 start_codon:yes stop_codon:yes gene_type:complete
MGLEQLNESLKSTPLLNEHIKLNASMVPFGGWNMPVQYTNVIDEHMTTRTKVGLFDICHMGEFLVSGPNSLEFLQKMVTNDISTLDVNQACYNCLCYENGTVIDDLFIYNLGNSIFLVVVNASTIEKDFNWLEKHKFDGIKLKNVSDEVAKIDIQGPKAQETLQKLTIFDLNKIKRFRCELIKFNDFDERILTSRTGYTGEDGFEIYFNPKDAVLVWNKILEAGNEFGIKACGLGARDTLRIESCYSLYGHEINESLTPIEAGLDFVVKLNKDFIGKQVLEKQKANGTEKKLICFEMIEKSIPRENYDIISNNEKVGFVSSGTFSPLFKKGIGMGFIKSDMGIVGNNINISIRGKPYKAVIVKRPIYNFRGGK